LFPGDGRFNFKDAVSQTRIEQRYANRQPVELAFELWVDLDNGRSTARGSRAEVLSKETVVIVLRV
jgi:hypothetical protein